MIEATDRQLSRTYERNRFLFFLSLEDDTEDAPWMTMGELQFWSATGFAHILRNYAENQKLPWFVAGMMPILYHVPNIEERKQLSPDVFVTFVPDHPRSSFNVETEGRFPDFVLEVVSPSSSRRDQVIKRAAYEYLEVKEYALFTPKESEASVLQGFRLNERKSFDPWPLDDLGRLRSQVLGLDLVHRGRNLQAQTFAGELLLTPRESELQRLRAEDAARQAEAAARLAEAAARQAQTIAQQKEDATHLAEATVREVREENERLRREIDRLRQRQERP